MKPDYLVLDGSLISQNGAMLSDSGIFDSKMGFLDQKCLNRLELIMDDGFTRLYRVERPHGQVEQMSSL